MSPRRSSSRRFAPLARREGSRTHAGFVFRWSWFHSMSLANNQAAKRPYCLTSFVPLLTKACAKEKWRKCNGGRAVINSNEDDDGNILCVRMHLATPSTKRAPAPHVRSLAMARGDRWTQDTKTHRGPHKDEGHNPLHVRVFKRGKLAPPSSQLTPQA